MNRTYLIVSLFCFAVTGCDMVGANSSASSPDGDHKAQIEAQVVSLIERTVAGDVAAKQDLLGKWSFDFERVHSVELVSIAPWVEDGKPLGGSYSVLVDIRGARNGEVISESVELMASDVLKSGTWDFHAM